MIEFKHNKETGILEAWKDGKKIGEMETMGDEVKQDASQLHEPQRRDPSGT